MRAVFLDRDGVLNRDSDAFVRTPDEFVLLPGVPEAVARICRHGLAAVVISNQSGLARGYVTQQALSEMHHMLRDAVQRAGGDIAGIYYCPHVPEDHCACRKPSPYLVQLAAREHGIDLAASTFVGDKPADIACGHAAGCRTILVLTGKTAAYDPAAFATAPDHLCPDLPAAVDLILRSP